MINFENAKNFCNEDISKIENYDKAINDTTQTWHCHHRLEVTKSFICSRALLKEINMYFHRPADELIFLTLAEHTRIHFKNIPMKESQKENISKSSIGKKPTFKGKHHSKETKDRISKSEKGKTKSIFGKKFKQHYGITSADDINLYCREHGFYRKHGKCRWE